MKENNSKTKLKKRSVILILDRTIDYIAPLLHEFTYQAMSYDLLNISDEFIFEYEYETSEKLKKMKKVILDDKDKTWVNYRHKHVSEVGEEIKHEISDFLKKNDMFINKKDKKNTKIEDLSTLVQKLPQFKQQYDNYALHKTMLKLLTKKYEENSLYEIAEQEQNMATGQTSEGITPKNVLGSITNILRKNITSQDKLRLIILYIITNGGTINFNIIKVEIKKN
jgi:syntaxin-binding protein 1